MAREAVVVTEWAGDFSRDIWIKKQSQMWWSANFFRFDHGSGDTIAPSAGRVLDSDVEHSLGEGIRRWCIARFLPALFCAFAYSPQTCNHLVFVLVAFAVCFPCRAYADWLR